jgi:hypothetical protein
MYLDEFACMKNDAKIKFMWIQQIYWWQVQILQKPDKARKCIEASTK